MKEINNKPSNKKWTKENLIELFKKVSADKQMTRKEWIAHPETPSDMPVRCLFKTWNNFIKECGGIPYKPYLSELAQKNRDIAHRGKRSCAWKGGKIKDGNGYIQVWNPSHPNCKSAGYMHEHRLVMSEFLGRPLLKHENVHHKNGDRSDNRIENLELWTTTQPSGQRVEDKIKWAIEFLKQYNFEITSPELIKNHE